MKQRNSFVSNSSSSSFIVQVTPDNLAGETSITLSEEQIQTLKKYGFKYCYSPCLLQAEAGVLETCETIELAEERQKQEWEKRTELKTFEPEFSFYPPHYMTYSVICNQDEIAEFLIQNNIPFNAICHYGSESWKWRPGWSYYKVTQNPGINLSFNESETEKHLNISSVKHLGLLLYYTVKWNWKSPKKLLSRVNGTAKRLIFNWAVTNKHPIEDLK